MTSEVLTVAPEDTVGEAAEKMVARGVGSVLVSDYGRLIGILTERDLLRAVADRIHSSEARVREWMTREPITVTPDTPAEDAARTMLEHGFRHLPVVRRADDRDRQPARRARLVAEPAPLADASALERW